ARNVAVIATGGGPLPARAARAASAATPIVFQTASDPVAFGLVASLNRPGGMLTGVTRLSAELIPKRLEVLREVVPAAGSFAVLLNPANLTVETQEKEARNAAQALAIPVEMLKASTPADIETAFAAMRERNVRALLIGNDAFFNSRMDELAALTVRHLIPAS